MHVDKGVLFFDLIPWQKKALGLDNKVLVIGCVINLFLVKQLAI